MPPEKEENCAKCVHRRICEAWEDAEMVNASWYIKDCFEPRIMQDLTEDDFRVLIENTDLKRRKK